MYNEFDRLISFTSVHQAIHGERVLSNENVQYIAIPTPREIDISCGQCILFKAMEQDKVLKNFAQQEVVWNKLFSRNGEYRLYKQLKVEGYEPDL